MSVFRSSFGIVVIALIAVSWTWVAGCGEQGDSDPPATVSAQGDSNRPAAVSLADIERLGPNTTIDDVLRLTKGIPLYSVPVFDCPAEEGGVYVFLFLPTNELPDVPDSETAPLVAVIKVPSFADYMRGEGRYVYPKKVAGARFTGVPLPSAESTE